MYLQGSWHSCMPFVLCSSYHGSRAEKIQILVSLVNLGQFFWSLGSVGSVGYLSGFSGGFGLLVLWSLSCGEARSCLQAPSCADSQRLPGLILLLLLYIVLYHPPSSGVVFYGCIETHILMCVYCVWQLFFAV